MVLSRRFIGWILLLIGIAVAPISTQSAETLLHPTKGQGPLVFSTWDGFEVDKLASIWLIRRFIAPGATVHIYRRGKIIKEGIPFDTPDSLISRRFNKSTFEALLEHYRVEDKKLGDMARLIHDIEINTWEPRFFRKSREIEIACMDLVEKYKGSNDLLLERAMEYFDGLYGDLSEDLERGRD